MCLNTTAANTNCPIISLCLCLQYLYLVALVVKKKVATHMLEHKIPLHLIESLTLSPLYDNYVIVHCPQVPVLTCEPCISRQSIPLIYLQTPTQDHDIAIECDFKTELVYWIRSRKQIPVNFAAE